MGLEEDVIKMDREITSEIEKSKIPEYKPAEEVLGEDSPYLAPYESIDSEIVNNLYLAAKANDNETLDDFVNTELRPKKEIGLDELKFIREILKYALLKHGTDKRRIGKNVLYSRHVIDTARVLLQYDISSNVDFITMGGSLLHDITDEKKATVRTMKNELKLIIDSSDIVNKRKYRNAVNELGSIVKGLTNPSQSYEYFIEMLKERTPLSVKTVYYILKDELGIREVDGVMKKLKQAFEGRVPLDYRDILDEKEIHKLIGAVAEKAVIDERIFDTNKYILNIYRKKDRRVKKIKLGDRIVQANEMRMRPHNFGEFVWDTGKHVSTYFGAKLLDRWKLTRNLKHDIYEKIFKKLYDESKTKPQYFPGYFFCVAANKDTRNFDYASEDIDRYMDEKNYDGTYILLKHQLAKASMEKVSGKQMKHLLKRHILKKPAGNIDAEAQNEKDSGRIYIVINPHSEEATINDLWIDFYGAALRGDTEGLLKINEDKYLQYRHLKLHSLLAEGFLEDFVIDPVTGRFKYKDLKRLDKSHYKEIAF